VAELLSWQETDLPGQDGAPADSCL